MERIHDLGDAISVWIDFNIDSGGMLLIAAAAVFLVSASIFIFMISIVKQRAAVELANYGGSLRQPRSFVCRICFHRTYAESHIKQRYCVKCDKSFPESGNVTRFPKIESRDWPAKAREPAYRNMADRPAADRRSTRA